MEPLTPAQTEAELRRLTRKLEERTDALTQLLVSAAEADVEYRIAYSTAFLKADGKTDKAREANATLAVAQMLRVRKNSEAYADACREAVRSLRDQLSAVQSCNANVRHQAGLT